MTIFTTVVLVCSIHVSVADCDRTTALNVLPPVEVQNEVMCAKTGMGILASTELRPRPDQEYAKILCERAEGADRI